MEGWRDGVSPNFKGASYEAPKSAREPRDPATGVRSKPGSHAQFITRNLRDVPWKSGEFPVEALEKWRRSGSPARVVGCRMSIGCVKADGFREDPNVLYIYIPKLGTSSNWKSSLYWIQIIWEWLSLARD